MLFRERRQKNIKAERRTRSATPPMATPIIAPVPRGDFEAADETGADVEVWAETGAVDEGSVAMVVGVFLFALVEGGGPVVFVELRILVVDSLVSLS